MPTIARIASARSSTVVSSAMPRRAGVAAAGELRDRPGVPAGRQVAEPVAQAGGQLDVRQRVPAELDEAAVARWRPGGRAPARSRRGSPRRWVAGSRPRPAGRGPRRRQAGLPLEGGPVRLAARGDRQLRQDVDPDRPGREPAQLGRRRVDRVGGPPVAEEEVQDLVGDDAAHGAPHGVPARTGAARPGPGRSAGRTAWRTGRGGRRSRRRRRWPGPGRRCAARRCRPPGPGRPVTVAYPIITFGPV